MKQFFKNPINTIITITCLIVVIYFGILIYKELKPKTYKEKVMQCLEVGAGSNAVANRCIELISK
jgi:hypothetical protein